MNLIHYVEEVLIEIDYQKGLSERKNVFSITSREDYKPLPWVKEYKFFDLDKETKDKSKPINVSPSICNPKYNPLYYMDDQIKMIKDHKIEIILMHYVKEVWIEASNSGNTYEKKYISPITNREIYQPTPWVKEYSFFDLIKISVDGKITVNDKTPLNVSSIIHNKNLETKKEINQPHSKRKKIVTPIQYKSPKIIGANIT